MTGLRLTAQRMVVFGVDVGQGAARRSRRRAEQGGRDAQLSDDRCRPGVARCPRQVFLLRHRGWRELADRMDRFGINPDGTVASWTRS
jgi:hypothetical protein